MLNTQLKDSASHYQNVEILDEEGYLIDTYEWSREFTERQARQVNVELQDKHWALIELIRDKYLRLGALPPMRIVCKSVGIDRNDVKKQFGSCLNFWKIAGLPNPGEEARAYMN